MTDAGPPRWSTAVRPAMCRQREQLATVQRAIAAIEGIAALVATAPGPSPPIAKRRPIAL